MRPASMTRRAGLQVRVLEDLGEVGRDSWTALVERSDAPAFYSYDFLTSVARHPLTRTARSFYLVAYDQGELCAGLPVYLQRAADPFSPGAPPVRSLLSHIWHCYDTRLISVVNLSAALVDGFWSALARLAAELSAERWGLVNVAMREPLARVLTQIGVPIQEGVPRYRLALAGGPGSLDEHLAGIGRASRRGLRQQVRRAQRAGSAIRIGTGHDLLDQDVLDLCLATADKHAPGYYPPDAMAALVAALGSACTILRVELEGELLATSVCLRDRRRLHTWAGGSRYPDHLNWSPQYVLFHAELVAAFQERPEILECGRRNDEFKLRYGLHPFPLGHAVMDGRT